MVTVMVMLMGGADTWGSWAKNKGKREKGKGKRLCADMTCPGVQASD